MTRTLLLSLAAASLLAGSAATAATKTTTPARMVTTKTKTGKTITYNCSKPGNATKAACKK